MAKRAVWIGVVAMLLAGTLQAQDITGDWQGTLKVGADLRIILRISKLADGGWTAMMSSIELQVRRRRVIPQTGWAMTFWPYSTP